MATAPAIRQRLQELQEEYIDLQKNKELIEATIDKNEIPEIIYNSNAIENSSLSLKETEAIVSEDKLPRGVSTREAFEAKNLFQVITYKRGDARNEPLTKNLMLTLHKMLITNIDDSIAGRFRQTGEYVRVANHIAPPPEAVEPMLQNILLDYIKDLNGFFLDKIAKFHLDFETIHPFCDGNGRIGRVLINFQLLQLGIPPVIIRNKGKQTYYDALRQYNESENTEPMEKHIELALLESFHKRITHLREDGKVVTLAEDARKNNLSASARLNAARRQTIPAFRERGVWKIGEGYEHTTSGQK